MSNHHHHQEPADYPPPGRQHPPAVHFAYWLAGGLQDPLGDRIEHCFMETNNGSWDDTFTVVTLHHSFRVTVESLPHPHGVGDQSVEDSVPISGGGEVDQVEVVGDVVEEDTYPAELLADPVEGQ